MNLPKEKPFSQVKNSQQLSHVGEIARAFVQCLLEKDFSHNTSTKNKILLKKTLKIYIWVQIKNKVYMNQRKNLNNC
jgi:hypothetical protein